jgi:hypothetical protein
MEAKINAELENVKSPKPTVSTARKGILPPGKSMEDYLGLSVINLSDVDLTEFQVNALSKGLTFCPTPWEPNMSDIIQNLESFFRRMRLKSHFFDEEYDDLEDDLEDTTNLIHLLCMSKKLPLKLTNQSGNNSSQRVTTFPQPRKTY